MGMCVSQQNAAVRGYQRRRELLFLFYFIVGFITIRIWIIIIQSDDLYAEISAGGLTIMILLCLCYRYRRLRQERQARNLILQPGEGTPDLVHTMLEESRAGLSQELLGALRTFYFESQAANKSISDAAQSKVELPKEGTIACNNSSERNSESSNIRSTEIEEAVIFNPLSPPPTINAFADPFSCSICLAEYIDGERILELPCMHQYHYACASEWLIRHGLCPLCKQNVRSLLTAQHTMQSLHSLHSDGRTHTNITNSNDSTSNELESPMAVENSDIEAQTENGAAHEDATDSDNNNSNNNSNQT